MNGAATRLAINNIRHQVITAEIIVGQEELARRAGCSKSMVADFGAGKQWQTQPRAPRVKLVRLIETAREIIDEHARLT